MNTKGLLMRNDIRLALHLESARMGAIAESALRRVLDQLEATDGVSPLIWRPMTITPPARSTAMIRGTEPDGAVLLPGPVVWSVAHECWVSEDTDQPIKLALPDVTYHWCYEHEITGGRP